MPYLHASDYSPHDVFPLGRVLVTPAAIDALVDAGYSGTPLLDRHRRADWGDVDANDHAANDAALVNGSRVLSAYTLCTGQQVWIITEADRSCTTLLLPSDY